MKTEWECTDLKCTHYDGDRCTLGFCEPDILAIDIKDYPLDYKPTPECDCGTWNDEHGEDCELIVDLEIEED